MKQQRTAGRNLTRRTLLADAGLIAGGLLLPARLRGQTASAPATPPAAQPVPPGGMNGVAPGTPMPADGKSPYAYTGISGPGWPVDAASGHGGYRSGNNGLVYQGEHP